MSYEATSSSSQKHLQAEVDVKSYHEIDVLRKTETFQHTWKPDSLNDSMLVIVTIGTV